MNEVSTAARPAAATRNLSGVFAAVMTPLTADLKPDPARHAEHSKWLLANGCDGLGVLGTTGEANAFSVDERKAIVEGLAKAGIPAAKMMPGVGCCAVPDTVALTKHALDMGVKGVLALPPFYYKNVSDDGLVDAYSQVIDQVNDSRLRLYVYHFPQMSATPIGFDVIGRLRDRYGDVMAGMKDSSGVVENMVGAARNFPGFEVFAGADPALKPLSEGGGAGCITAACNVIPQVLAEIWSGWRDGKADKAHEVACAVRPLIAAAAPIASMKSLIARHRGDDGWLPVRPPLRQISDAQRADLFTMFDAVGCPLPPA